MPKASVLPNTKGLIVKYKIETQYSTFIFSIIMI